MFTQLHTQVFSAEGRRLNLSQIAQLTRGKASYPDRFYQRTYTQLNVILHNLSEQDICCDKKCWIDLGRNGIDPYDQQDSKG